MSRADMNAVEEEEGMYSVYSTRYSDWTNKWNQITQLSDTEDVQVPLAALSCAIPLALIVFIFVLSMVMVSFNLRIEPIELLGSSGVRYRGTTLALYAQN